MSDVQEQQLLEIVGSVPWFMQALQAGASLGLQDWCIGAGALRNVVWDALHQRSEPGLPLSDVDFTYFDPSCLDESSEQLWQSALMRVCPTLPWEVTNQAGVHLWYEAIFGFPVAPLRSLTDAVATWPEYATAVAVTMSASGQLGVIAPYGLDDLLHMKIRHNPVRVPYAHFCERTAQRNYQLRWPQVEVVM